MFESGIVLKEIFEKIGYIMLGLLLFIFLATIICFALAWPTQLLWNWLMPEIFNLPEITFWQALGILILSSFIFGSRSSSASSSK